MARNNLSSIEDILKRIARKIETPNQRNYYSYSQLLRDCLPEKWHNRVVLGKIEFGKWELWVSNAIEGQQLRFFAIEIEARLAKKLPHPPKLHIKPRPDVWSGKRYYSPKGKIYPRRHLSEQEADAILDAFLQEEL